MYYRHALLTVVFLYGLIKEIGHSASIEKQAGKESRGVLLSAHCYFGMTCGERKYHHFRTNLDHSLATNRYHLINNTMFDPTKLYFIDFIYHTLL
jgi:hypothetical protein